MSDKITIIVATHKPYEMPTDPMYLALQVGAFGKEDLFNPKSNFPCARDDSGDHISQKNSTYSELTGLYWAWKNIDSDYIGLVHYRRHFTLMNRLSRQNRILTDCVLSSPQAKNILSQDSGTATESLPSVILPTKRNYYIESLYSHYAHTLDASHLDIAKSIILLHDATYTKAIDTVFNRKWGYMWNMMVFPKNLLNNYCAWLFAILEEMETQIPTDDLSAFHARLFGRVSEILLNIWIEKNQPALFHIQEVPVFSMESTPWIKKGSAFLAAKFLNRHYEESF